MELNIEEIKIGDYVKVKNGIKAPDFDYQLMDNWQGKIVDIQKSENLVDIEWDSETLLNTPEKYLKDLIKQGYDYEIMTLEISELEGANRRDNSDQRKDVKSKLDTKLYWIELFESYGFEFQKQETDHIRGISSMKRDFVRHYGHFFVKK